MREQEQVYKLMHDFEVQIFDQLADMSNKLKEIMPDRPNTTNVLYQNLIQNIARRMLVCSFGYQYYKAKSEAERGAIEDFVEDYLEDISEDIFTSYQAFAEETDFFETITKGGLYEDDA